MSSNFDEAEPFLKPIIFPIDRWNQMIADGELRSRQKLNFSSTRNARDGTHELGMIGEALFGDLIGQSVNRALLVNGDGKVDFVVGGVRFDVKTTSYYDRPWLRVTPDDLKSVGAFALVAVDEKKRMARYCGYATSAMVLAGVFGQMNSKMPASYKLTEKQIVPKLPTAS